MPKQKPETRCPRCGEPAKKNWRVEIEDEKGKERMKSFRGGFVECGEYVGSAYEYEANITLYRCSICGCRFGVDDCS